MARVAMLNPDQAKAIRDRHYAVTYLRVNFTPLREACAADMAQAGHTVFRVVDFHTEIIVCQCRQPHGITWEGQYRVNDGFNHCPVARNQLTRDIHLTSPQLFKRVKRHQIRATPGGNQPQIVTLQANGSVQRGKTQRVRCR